MLSVWIFAPGGRLETAPVDDVQALHMARDFAAAGVAADLQVWLASDARRWAAAVEAGEAIVFRTKKTSLLVPAAVDLEQLEAVLQTNPAEAAATKIKAIHKQALAKMVAAAKAHKPVHGPFAPVVGGFPLLDAEPPEGGWTKPAEHVAAVPPPRELVAFDSEAGTARPASWLERLVAALLWLVAPTIPPEAVR